MTRRYYLPRDGEFVRVMASSLENHAIKNRHLQYKTANIQSLASRPVLASTCERCGKAGPTVGHHNDYAKPREVESLCGSCHPKRHAELRVAACVALGGYVVEGRRIVAGAENLKSAVNPCADEAAQ